MRSMLLALGMVAVVACQRESAPPSQPGTPDAAQKPAIADTVKTQTRASAATAPAPTTPVAEDTSTDKASHLTGAPVAVMLTAVQEIAPVTEGTHVLAHFADTQIACKVVLESTLVAGQAGEGQLICEQPLNLRAGAFEFSLHEDGQHVADGVVLR